jgi:hypothetical protein
MPDVEKILRLVAEGVLTAEEADEILGGAQKLPDQEIEPQRETGTRETGTRQLRIEVSEGGRRVVNLRVPMNIASLASAFVPGLSDEHGERIRAAIAAGARGPILDIGTDDGDRVLIISE